MRIELRFFEKGIFVKFPVLVYSTTPLIGVAVGSGVKVVVGSGMTVAVTVDNAVFVAGLIVMGVEAGAHEAKRTAKNMSIENFFKIHGMRS
ncbi:MAG TPA: hypothetical protein PLV64_23985 [Anaerolineales bacterium]|nr:hypothetical protein [Anaerolineales bacterium]